ncbi:MAG: tetratricopeptide repeat protein [Deltaproteobacteria bacterium]|nr:tetratricopeptide repeat protein [Deltaproteobacteria bacterium]
MRKLQSWLLASSLALSPIIFSSAARADKKADAVVLVDEGKVFFKAKDYGPAFAKFRAAADLDSTHPTALYNAALAARKGGLLAEAAVAYADLLKLHPDDLDAVYGLAETQRALSHYDEARGLYERYVRDEKRAERQELVEKSKAALGALPTDVPKAATPSLERAAADVPAAAVVATVSDAAKARAQELFDEGQAFAKLLRFDDATARFLAAAELDPARLDAVLRAALMLRKGNALDRSKTAYEQVLSSTTPAANPLQILDATYGLAETERLRGEKLHAAELFTRYADNETRPGEERYVTRARELAALLRQEAGAAVAVVAVPVLPVVVPVIVPPIPVIAPPIPALPIPVIAPPVPAVVEPPVVAVVVPPVVKPEPAIAAPVEAPIAAAPIAPPVIEPVAVVEAPVVAAPAPPPPAALSFFGDGLVVDQLIERARAADAAEAPETAGALWARARSLAPGDPRLPPPATAKSAPCDVERQLATGEHALATENPADAIAAFRRARVCDPRRAAPLWGLSRAFDEVGAKKQAKHHAHLYARSNAPDRDPTSASKAAWRSEQPD